MRMLFISRWRISIGTIMQMARRTAVLMTSDLMWERQPKPEGSMKVVPVDDRCSGLSTDSVEGGIACCKCFSYVLTASLVFCRLDYKCADKRECARVMLGG